MKNIHIIPTDKPTGIFESKNGLHFSIIEKIRYGEFKGFHIYITSDEEIKEGDWFVQVNTKKIIKHHPKNGLLLQPQSFDKKVILTTDQDLIKDGVQEIDEEYLEWFVKNPSCEKVKLENHVLELGYNHYKIIIPQEEPKKETLEEASWKYNPLKKLDGEFLRHAFKDGAKWQAERMYSEEEVLEMLCKSHNAENTSIVANTIMKWFEQNKNK